VAVDGVEMEKYGAFKFQSYIPLLPVPACNKRTNIPKKSAALIQIPEQGCLDLQLTYTISLAALEIIANPNLGDSNPHIVRNANPPSKHGDTFTKHKRTATWQPLASCEQTAAGNQRR
jgi:hypothetical protein